MSVRGAVGGWLSRAGARLQGGVAEQRVAEQSRAINEQGPPYNLDRPVGNTEAAPASRQVWELRTARIASRNLAEGSPHLRAFLEWALVHVTGAGETRLHWPRARGMERLRAAQEWLRDEWLAFQGRPYGARGETVPVLGQQILTTMLRDGDAFAIPYWERGTTGARRRRLQVYPGDALAEVEYSGGVSVRTGGDGPYRALGITYDERGRPVTYHFGHGGRVQPVGWGGYASEVDQVPVPARRVWHFLDSARIDPQTLRCLPWATAALDPISRLDEYDRAFIRAALTRASIGLALVKDSEKTAVGGAALTAAERAAAAGGEGGAIRETPLYRERQRRAGNVLEIAEGYTTANTYPGSPNAQEALHLERVEKRICGALGVSLSTLFGDYKGQNFSASQQGTLQEKEKVKRLQRLLVRVYYARVYQGFFAPRWPVMLVMFPGLMAEDEAPLRNPMLRLPQYVALEKQRMIPAVIAAFLNGLLTYAESRDQLGESIADIEAVMAQVKEDHKALGITIAGAAGGATMPPAGDSGDEEDGDGEEESGEEGDDEE